VHLTPTQIRSTLRARVEWPEGDAGDRLAGDLCRRLAQLPDVRWAKVEEVTARLAVLGAPPAVLLADMLVAHLAPGTAPGAVPRAHRRTRGYARRVAHGSVVASRCQSQAKRPT
jgi:hypothetical protein